jgi:TonB family protein
VPSGAPKGNYLSTGPIGGTGAKTGSHSGGTASGTGHSTGRGYAPTPSLSTYKGTGGSGSGASRGSGSSHGTGGYAGNPAGGGGRPGIDAIKEPDFGPYMRELQRRIKFNWNPPKGNESKRVVLLFKIAKSGQLLSCRVFRSSGLPAADQAALNAVKLTAPFRPLPAEYKGSSIDIQFTFDYNVFGATKY